MTGIASSNRRTFIKRAAATTALAVPVLGYYLKSSTSSPSDTVRHASFGASGMAGADLREIAKHPKVQLVCVADVDMNRAADLKREFPKIRVYQDWRRMLDKEHKHLDSVNVSTPDHMHAAMGLWAMQRGLHVYGQKPLTHNVYESRRLATFATEKKLVTQMGIQIHSSAVYRSAVQLIQSGAIGKVKSVHSWSNKKWGDPAPRPDKEDQVPSTFDWDLWLGVAEKRPFIGNEYYHRANWRKRLDFGTGTFGDMGCHIFDPVFNALELTAPLSVRSTSHAPNAHNWANDAVVHFVFPQTAHTVGPIVEITWYDGDQRPPKEIVASVLADAALPEQGSLFLGHAGALLLPHIGAPQLLPEKEFAEYPKPQLEDINHWHQFVDAVRGDGNTSAHFGYAGPLTESVLLGAAATHLPDQSLEWDAKRLEFTNIKEANRLLRRSYRMGWEVPGLS